MREQIFEKLFEVAEIAKFTHNELMEYEESLKSYRDLQNSIDTAVEEGETKGRIKGRIEGINEVAKNLLKNGIDIEVIKNVTGLTENEINTL